MRVGVAEGEARLRGAGLQKTGLPPTDSRCCGGYRADGLPLAEIWWRESVALHWNLLYWRELRRSGV